MLVVAQTRDRRGNLSGVKLSALSLALTQIYSAAKKKNGKEFIDPRIYWTLYMTAVLSLSPDWP